MLIPWRSMLTREAQVCRVCFDAGVRPSVPLVPFKENIALLRGNHGSFNAKRKAALKRHIQSAHPEWEEKIAWSSKRQSASSTGAGGATSPGATTTPGMKRSRSRNAPNAGAS